VAEFLLELLSEEIPARMQTRASDDLRRLVSEKLTEAGLGFGKADAYATPRRLALHIEGLPPRQPDREIEVKGPRVGAAENVLQSFLKARGLASLDACEQRESGRGAFWFYVERVAGRPTAEVLAEILPAAIAGLPWPKSMRWAYDRQSWVRPLRNIAAVLDGALVPFELELGSPAHPRRIASRNASWDRRASSLRISRATRPASSRARSCSIRRSGAIRFASRRRASRARSPSASAPTRRCSTRWSGWWNGRSSCWGASMPLSWTCRRRC
jgi:glycyl-tRNA synthetase beta subunit